VTSLAQDQFEDEVEAEWFSAVVDRKRLKALMRRSDLAGWRHFGLWLALLVGSLVGIVATWWSWWSVPFLGVYGVMYAMSDHHAHELSHGTPFKTRRVNEILYHLNSFMTLHEAYYWRWSHTRHHTDTLSVGRGPEIALQSLRGRVVRLEDAVERRIQRLELGFLGSHGVEVSGVVTRALLRQRLHHLGHVLGPTDPLV